jgi:hypothetical protein
MQLKRKDEIATRDRHVMNAVIRFIEGAVQDPRCVCAYTPFTNLDHLTDGSLVAAKPARCFGARPKSLEQQVRDRLAHTICPFTQEDLPILPNFFLEAKGRYGSLKVAERQLLYVMSLGERGFLHLLSYGSELVYDNMAHTIGFSYRRGLLSAYTCHAAPPSTTTGRPSFVMTFIDSWNLEQNLQEFRKGARAYHNGIKWAEMMRDRAIHQANSEVASLGSSPPVENGVVYIGSSPPVKIEEDSLGSSVLVKSEVDSTLPMLTMSTSNSTSISEPENSGSGLFTDEARVVPVYSSGSL